MSKKSHHFLTLWPWPLTYDVEKLIRSGHYHYQCVYQIWEQFIPWFLSFRVNTIVGGGRRVAGGGRLRRKTITSPDPSDTGDIISQHCSCWWPGFIAPVAINSHNADPRTILSTPYAVLPLFATRFSACTGGIWVSFIVPYLLNWYKRVCMGDLACTFIWIKFTNMFPQYFKSGVHRHFHWSLNYCSSNVDPHCFYVCVHQQWPKTLVEICRNMDIRDVFTQAALRQMYIQVLFFPASKDFLLW